MRLLVTAGPTREYLDPVRFISNASSGRQGLALARAAAARGWQVDLVHGPLEVPVSAAERNGASFRGVTWHPVTTAQEMLAACRSLYPSCDALVGAAAVSDYRPAKPRDAKRKRQGMWTIELRPTEDILAALAADKQKRPGRRHVGFALESTDLEVNARSKLEQKGLDWIVGNAPSAIGAEAAEYLILGADGSRTPLARRTKDELAEIVLDLIDETSSEDVD